MPQSKRPQSLFHQATAQMGRMVQSTLVRLDSVWSCRSLRKCKKGKSPKQSPKTSPISYRMASVMLPPSSNNTHQLASGLAPLQVADPIDLIRWTNAGAPNIPIDYDE